MIFWKMSVKSHSYIGLGIRLALLDHNGASGAIIGLAKIHLVHCFRRIRIIRSYLLCLSGGMCWSVLDCQSSSSLTIYFTSSPDPPFLLYGQHRDLKVCVAYSSLVAVRTIFLPPVESLIALNGGVQTTSRVYN